MLRCHLAAPACRLLRGWVPAAATCVGAKSPQQARHLRTPEAPPIPLTLRSALPHPHSHSLSVCLSAGIGYGLYLTISTWALFYVATHTDFFEARLGMYSLEETKVGGRVTGDSTRGGRGKGKREAGGVVCHRGCQRCRCCRCLFCAPWKVWQLLYSLEETKVSE